ncbi:DKNYY domain-containing protein [Prevotella koreensis]|uniref:DKNYY domain-containing protein n=1 Tax=Prevotella koreensis TaxID=2490854 RepID=UPI003FA01BAB
MKQIHFKTLRCSALLLFVAFTLSISAQTQQQKMKPYSLNRNKVYYQRQPIVEADYRSFVDLGFGYAKDRYNVYYLGRILPYVDPLTFSLRVAIQPYPDDYYPTDDDMYDRDDYYGYRITSNAVLFRGKKISDSPKSFRDLGWGYGKDNFDVFYMGEKMDGVFSSSFKVLEDGYAEDSFDTYYKGRKVK